MSSSLTLAIMLAVLAAALVWLFGGARMWRRPDPGDVAGEPGGDPDSDSDMLDEAEEEVRDVDAFATPEDAREDLPDWGPGAPKS
jgi:hypothetical protein